MNGFNYAATQRRTIDPFAWLQAGSRRFRIAVALFAMATAGIALVTGIEQRRLADLDRRVIELRSTAQRAAAAAGRAAAGNATFEHMRQLAARLALARRETIESSNAAILVGNALPPRTWLVQLDATSPAHWTLSGKSMTLDEIGTTLRALQRLDGRSTLRLVSVSSNAQPGKPYDFVITRETAR